MRFWIWGMNEGKGNPGQERLHTLKAQEWRSTRIQQSKRKGSASKSRVLGTAIGQC